LKISFQNSRCGCRQQSDLIRSLTFFLLLPALLSAQGGPNGGSMPIIDMHFHTTWVAPERKEALTSFISPKTPDELRRLNLDAVNRYHIVKVVASGDQLASYEQDLGPRLIPGMFISREKDTPTALRQRHTSDIGHSTKRLFIPKISCTPITGRRRRTLILRVALMAAGRR